MAITIKTYRHTSTYAADPTGVLVDTESVASLPSAVSVNTTGWPAGSYELTVTQEPDTNFLESAKSAPYSITVDPPTTTTTTTGTTSAPGTFVETFENWVTGSSWVGDEGFTWAPYQGMTVSRDPANSRTGSQCAKFPWDSYSSFFSSLKMTGPVTIPQNAVMTFWAKFPSKSATTSVGISVRDSAGAIKGSVAIPLANMSSSYQQFQITLSTLGLNAEDLVIRLDASGSDPYGYMDIDDITFNW